jgi:hypothetical protein
MKNSSGPGCDTGIDALGRIPWGSHFCNFYRAQSDLAACIVPFFQKALADNEMGLWITSDPLNRREAARLLGQAVPDLAAREASGQMLILDFADWYLDRNDEVTAQALRTAIDRLVEAQRRGFAGVRMTGNSYWLERKYWTLFNEYEDKLHAAVRASRIVVLCSYSLERCTASDVLQALTHHDFALAHDERGWQRMESARLS